MLYFDNAATTYPKPDEVTQKMIDFITSCGASPGRGGYSTAFEASQMLFETQEAIAQLFSIPSSERIAFTKNATEAINTAIFGLVKPGDEIIISSMEHNAVLRPAYECSKRGALLKIAHASPTGVVSPERIEQLITEKTKLICLIHASNVSGSINDIYAVQRIAKKHGVYALFDCSQTAGIIPVDASELDIVAFAGHKGLFGSMGTGVLYVREGINIRPLLYGGTGSFSESADMPDIYPDIFHAGTVNAPGIASLLAGCNFIMREGVYEKEEEITKYMYDQFAEIPHIILPGERKRTGAISVMYPSFDCVSIAEQLSKENIATRAGLHCAPMAHRTLGTVSRGTVRFSPGFFTKKSDVDTAVSAFKKIIGK